MKQEHDQQWTDLKHRYPLGHTSWRKALDHKSFDTSIYRDHNKQLGLGWLGEVAHTQPVRDKVC
ncbi:MAG: hypothetical protein GFH27_549307n54 [Chloroflexi bacterium AL-W]|nr:hypothetical protein [Chloroflexi bacterium AL-N1]NOK69086.1 hypothetical protein [Chloroflexi bacterium AL-N10]NOK77069.1 hypothetical protein [Chloroflexi bacterium AL-N5]NOK83714.1 hypothetical protein [Chloroflexi bacterium AL-W]NOK90924.1 hypothetical protein [Chloroflexi bacterium AL-N15]